MEIFIHLLFIVLKNVGAVDCFLITGTKGSEESWQATQKCWGLGEVDSNSQKIQTRF